MRAVLIGLAVAALVLAGAWWLARPDSSEQLYAWAKPADVEGDVVHLEYGGSPCRSGVRVEVDETDDRVVLAVYEQSDGSRTCDDRGAVHAVDVRLAAPLGQRDLLDYACLPPRGGGDPDCERPALPRR